MQDFIYKIIKKVWVSRKKDPKYFHSFVCGQSIRKVEGRLQQIIFPLSESKIFLNRPLCVYTTMLTVGQIRNSYNKYLDILCFSLALFKDYVSLTEIKMQSDIHFKF